MRCFSDSSRPEYGESSQRAETIRGTRELPWSMRVCMRTDLRSGSGPHTNALYSPPGISGDGTERDLVRFFRSPSHSASISATWARNWLIIWELVAVEANIAWVVVPPKLMATANPQNATMRNSCVTLATLLTLGVDHESPGTIPLGSRLQTNLCVACCDVLMRAKGNEKDLTIREDLEQEMALSQHE